MNRTLLALWVIIFGFLVAIVALVVVFTNQREAQARLDLAGLLRAQLDVHNLRVRELFEQYDRQLQQAVEDFDPENEGALLALERHPLCGLVIVVGADGFKGRLWHPKPEQISVVDRSLVEDAVTWIRDSNFVAQANFNNSYLQTGQVSLPQTPNQTQAQHPIPAPAQLAPPPSVLGSPATPWPENAPSSNAPSSNSLPLPNSLRWTKRNLLSSNGIDSGKDPLRGTKQSAVDRGRSHWTTWYHGRGLVLGYWTESLHDTVTMVLVPRGRWLSDLVAELPDNSESQAGGLTQLVDVEGTIVTQWGNLDLTDSGSVDAELPVDDPLEGWRLRMILTPEARSAALGLDNRWWRGLVAGGFSLALVLLGVLVTVNINRQLYLAGQQVSFVNQVSHELRTPLTNIRMYTDLTMQGLEAHREIGIESEIDRLVVIQQETVRLGRLIENVLTFARSGKHRLLRTSSVSNAESLIDGVLATFEPQLSECNMIVERSMVVERTMGDLQPLFIDREALEQILVNLISNAIKYAATGRLLRIETIYGVGELTIHVTDNGPGIPKRLRSRVFDPFVRGSNRLEAPAGTGIGLTIARQLARQHGGDCQLRPTPTGSTFIVTIHSQR